MKCAIKERNSLFGYKGWHIFGVILTICTFVPMVYTYVRYRRKYGTPEIAEKLWSIVSSRVEAVSENLKN